MGANQVSKNPGTKETQTQSNLILDFGEESRTGKKGKGGQSGADISDILGPPIPTNQMIQPPGPQQIMGPVPPPGIYQPPMQQAQTVQFNNPPIPIQSNQAYQGPMQPHIPQQQSNLAQQPQLPIQPVQPHHIRMQPYPQQRPPLTGIPGPVRESVQVQQPAPQMQQQIQVPGRSQPSPPTMTQYQSASWICPNCGTNVDANYSFCMSCGHKKGI